MNAKVKVQTPNKDIIIAKVKFGETLEDGKPLHYVIVKKNITELIF